MNNQPDEVAVNDRWFNSTEHNCHRWSSESKAGQEQVHHIPSVLSSRARLPVPEGIKACERSRLSVGAGVAQEVVQHQSSQWLLHQFTVRRVKDQVTKVLQAEELLWAVCQGEDDWLEQRRRQRNSWHTDLSQLYRAAQHVYLFIPLHQVQKKKNSSQDNTSSAFVLLWKHIIHAVLLMNVHVIPDVLDNVHVDTSG